MLRVDLNDKRYMCSPEFWQDKHNSETASLIDDLMFQRDLLSTIPQDSPKDFFQRSDGFVVRKNRLGFLKFLKGPGYYESKFADNMNKQYELIKADLKHLSNKAKNEINYEI